MLRLSKLGDYGTVIMAHIAREPRRLFSAGEIAAHSGIGAPTVSKLLKRLARDGLLVSQRGARGGYALARAPGEISLAQIIDAVEGPLAMTECSARAGLCALERDCPARARWQAVNGVVRAALDGVRLADFAPAAGDAPAARAIIERPSARRARG